MAENESGQIEEQAYPRVTEEEVKAMFQNLDVDGTGTVSQSELREGLMLCGMDLTRDDMANLLRNSDVDGDGEFNEDEFCKVLPQLLQKVDGPAMEEGHQEAVKIIMECCDKDGSGCIDREEFRNFLMMRGDEGERMSQEDCDEMFREFESIDTDGSGNITANELMRYLRNEMHAGDA